MEYPCTSVAYLERMKARMEEGTKPALIYAALELRLGVEARLREYVWAIDHLPKSQKNEWKVAKLGRSIESAYQTGDKIMIFTIRFPEDGAELKLLYTPVSERLRDIAERLGDFLHAKNHTQADKPEWWIELRKYLDEAYPLLMLATSGELVGLPLIHEPSGRVKAQAVIQSGDPRQELMSRLIKGSKHVISLMHIDPVPGSFTFYEK